MNPHDRLKLFLFYLQREHVPTGVIEEAIKFVNDTEPREPVYDSPGMELLIEDQAKRLKFQ